MYGPLRMGKHQLPQQGEDSKHSKTQMLGEILYFQFPAVESKYSSECLPLGSGLSNRWL